MADAKISELTAIDAVTGVDLLAVVDDPAGTPATKKATAAQVKDYIIGLANTWTATQTISGGGLVLSGNISSAAWTTNGLRLRGVPGTLTDTSSSGTVAAAYTNVLGGNTIAASNSTTFTDYFTTYINPPSAGTNVTLTRGWALGLGGNLQIASASEQFFGTDLRIGRRDTANIRLGAADTSGVAATVTITIASPGVVTWTAHGLSTGTPVVFTTTGALPTGITSGTTYYVIAVDADTFRIATTLANAVAGTAVNTSGSQSGTHTGTRYNVTQRISMQGNTGVSNRLGADLIIQGSQGTGTGAGGSIIFQVAPAGSSGTAQNALVNVLTIASDGIVTFPLGGVAALRAGGEGFSAIAGGNITAGFSQFGCRLSSSLSLSWSSSNNPNSSIDTILLRDAANTLALRNVNNGQTLRVYGRYTSDTNHERFFVTAPTTSGAAVQLGTDKGSGGGTARNLEIQTDGTTRVTVTTLGNVVTNTAAVATTATDGFLYVPTCAGTPTGTPTTQTGTAPIVVDTTNNKLYFYSGGQWRDAGP